MFIDSYKSIHATEDHGTYKSIEGISRSSYMTTTYVRLLNEYLATIKTVGKVAVLYAGGAVCHQAEARQVTEALRTRNPSIAVNGSTAVVKETAAYMLHRWVSALGCKDDIVYANINGDACASSMHSLYEAEQLLRDGIVDEVIIIAEERTAFGTVRIFNEHRINVTPSDGVVVMKVSLTPSDLEITDTKWAYSYSGSPFYSSSKGYDMVNTEGCEYVNPHASGTEQNEEAEKNITKDKKILEFKSIIGHAQGVSGILELCIVAEDQSVKGRVLCTASGVGNFYGSCVLNKT